MISRHIESVTKKGIKKFAVEVEGDIIAFGTPQQLVAAARYIIDEISLPAKD